MKTTRRYLELCALGLLTGWLISVPQAYANDSQTEPYQVPLMEFSKGKDGFFENNSDEAYLRYIWDSFVALNWPAASKLRGEADTKARIPASKHPVVWETWAQPQQVFLPSEQWTNYPSWDSLTAMPAGLSLSEAKSLCRGFSATEDIVLYDINQPNTSPSVGPVAPLMDQYRRYVRYGVMLNKSYFDYIQNHQYFDASVQEAAVRASQQAQYELASKPPPGAFVPLPVDTADGPGMIEMKSAWRVLDPEFDDPERYYSRPGFILSPDQQSCQRAPAGVGLVALHIHRITRLSHVGSTFEQIDNVETPADSDSPRPSFNPGTTNRTQTNIWPPYGNIGFQGNLPPVLDKNSILPLREYRQPNNISRATAIPENVRAINHEYQKRYQDSPIKFYQLINVQHVKNDCSMRETGNFSKPAEWQPSGCPVPNTATLINTALESYTQLVNPFTMQPYNYSCQGCHSNARPCGFSEEGTPELVFKPEFMVMSYLLGKAKYPGQKAAPPNYTCNNPVTQPLATPGN